jgi:thymidylate synthase ThyX
VSGKELRRWSDDAMFRSEDLDARTGPTATVLQMNNDPLGSVAAATLMYKGVVIRDLADVTDEQRREAWEQINTTKLKAPFEFVDIHILLEGVTRSFTHQGVRQRTATFTQESLRFAVVEDEFTSRVALPPSLVNSTSYEEWIDFAHREIGRDKILSDEEVQEYIERYAQPVDKARWQWDAAVQTVQMSYARLVDNGIPAEDARGLLPHNITTRYHWRTDLRALQDHGGNRLCTQAQFEWRAVWIRLVQAIRNYGASQWYYRPGPVLGGVPTRESFSSAWQFDLIADMFRPVCYLTGKCEFAAQDLDRKCSIRDRVDLFAANGVPSEQWESGATASTGQTTTLHIAPIHPREWLADPGAAR